MIIKTAKALFYTLILIGPGFYFGYIGKPTEMGISVVAGALAVAFLNLDKFQRFKGAGFEAEMKAEVQKVVEDAHATMQNLKDLATPLVISILVNLTHGGRWGGIEFQKKIHLKHDLDKIINLFHLENKELEDARANFIRYHTWDLYNGYYDHLYKAKIDKEILDQLSGINDRRSINYPTKEQIEAIVRPIASSLDSEATEKLLDYLQFKENQTLRRQIV